MNITKVPCFDEVCASVSDTDIQLRYMPYDDGENDPIPFIWEPDKLGFKPINKFWHSANGPSKTEFRLCGNKIELPTDRKFETNFIIPYFREVEARVVETLAEEFGRCLYCGCKLGADAIVCGQCGAPT